MYHNFVPSYGWICTYIPYVHIPYLVYPFFSWWISGLFLPLTILNSSAVNICVKVFFEHLFSILWAVHVGVELLGHMVNFVKNYQIGLQSSCIILHSHQQPTRVPVSPHLYRHVSFFLKGSFYNCSSDDLTALRWLPSCRIKIRILQGPRRWETWIPPSSPSPWLAFFLTSCQPRYPSHQFPKAPSCSHGRVFVLAVWNALPKHLHILLPYWSFSSNGICPKTFTLKKP